MRNCLRIATSKLVGMIGWTSFEIAMMKKQHFNRKLQQKLGTFNEFIALLILCVGDSLQRGKNVVLNCHRLAPNWNQNVCWY